MEEAIIDNFNVENRTHIFCARRNFIYWTNKLLSIIPIILSDQSVHFSKKILFFLEVSCKF